LELLPDLYVYISIEEEDGGKRIISYSKIMNDESKGFLKLTNIDQLMPQEEMLESVPQKSKIVIGLPKESSDNENRISLVPEAVQQLVDSGQKVLVEDGAGEGANFSNEQYASAGANIVSTYQEAYQSDIILKVAPPTEHELEMMGNTKSCFLHYSCQTPKKVSSIG